jgi:hypothetical protein
MNILIENISKIHTTLMGINRIKNNLELEALFTLRPFRDFYPAFVPEK